MSKTSESLKNIVRGLAAKRRKLKITQRGLAELMGVSATTVSRWERQNHKSLKVCELVKMLEVFEDAKNENL